MNSNPQVLETTRRIFKERGAETVTTEKPKNELWNSLEQAGLTLAWCPAEYNGPGGSIADGLSVIGVTGEFCDRLPVAETLLAGQLLAHANLKIPKGFLTFLFSDKEFEVKLDQKGLLTALAPNVPYATQAEHLVALAEGPSGYTVTLIAQKECSILSKTNVAGEARDEVSLEGVRPLQESKLITDINPNHLKLLGALTRSIQMTRSISKVLDICVDYSQQRPAFGRPISKFQAIQHYLATMAGEYAASLAVTVAAEQSFIRSEERGQLLDIVPIASAKIRVGEAANIVCSLAHQIHGAIGFTEEHILHRFTHRLWSWRNDYGTEAEWAVQLGSLVAQRGADEIWPDLTAE